MRAVVAFVILTSIAAPRVTQGAWVMNERGECVRTWTPGSLARGPAAMVNAPLLPVRSAVGGALLARDDRSPGVVGKVLLPPMLTLMGGAMGLLESCIWLGGGLADTVTAGYFALAPEEATRLDVRPVTPAFVPDARRTFRSPCQDSSARGG